MADTIDVSKIKFISDLTSAGALQDGDILPISRSGVPLGHVYTGAVAYGQIYYSCATSLTTVLTTSGTYYPIISTATEALLTNLSKNITVDVSTGNGSFTVQTSGIYKAEYYVSYSSNGNNYTYIASIFKNGAIYCPIESWRKIVQGSTVLSTACGGLIDLSEGDVVDLRFSSDTANAEVIANQIILVLTKVFDTE